MTLKAAGVFAILVLSGCAQPSQATKVTNLSASPVQVVYVSKDTGISKTISVGAGEGGSLGDLARLSNFASVEFRSADKNVIFRDTDPVWRDSGCAGDCEFVWYGDGRVAITA